MRVSCRKTQVENWNPANNKMIYAPLQPRNSSRTTEDIARKERGSRVYLLLAAFILYVCIGWVMYYLMEGWDLLESSLFTLSIVTGVGYGHLIPSSNVAEVFTSVFILLGLALFAIIAGSILDRLMQNEINVVLAAVESGGDETATQTFQKNQQNSKRNNFMFGCCNVLALWMTATFFNKFAMGEIWTHAIYIAAISVLKLDSICILDGVQCSPNRGAHQGSESKWLLFAIIWYLVTYSVIGHFVVSATNYMGIDMDANLNKISKLTGSHVEAMDQDGDGRVDKVEFLSARLVQEGYCTEETIASILKNFAALDRDASGHLCHKDLVP